MGKFVAYILLLAALAAGAAWYSQRELSMPCGVTSAHRDTAEAAWLDHLYSRNPRESDAAADAVRTLGEQAVPAIQAVLQDPDADRERRKAALKACVILGVTAAPAVPDVVAHLADPELTAEAAVALSFMGRGAYGPLRASLKSADPIVRREALRSIGKLQSRGPLDARAVTPLLLADLQDEDEGVRVVAATYLGIVLAQPEQAVPALVQALQDSDIEVRRAAATALGSFGNEARDAVSALRQAAGDRDEDLAREAGLALIRLQGHR